MDLPLSQYSFRVTIKQGWDYSLGILMFFFGEADLPK